MKKPETQVNNIESNDTTRLKAKLIKIIDDTLINIEMLNKICALPKIAEKITSFLEIKEKLSALKEYFPPSEIDALKIEVKQNIQSIHFIIKTWEDELNKNSQFNFELETEDVKKYGYKHARLIELNALLSKLPFQNIHVPLPHGVSNSTIQCFLKSNAPEIDDLWKTLRDLYDELNGNSDFLDNPKVTKTLENISKKIEEAFFKAKNDDTAYEMLGGDSLIAKLKPENYLMVRSSGSEDTHLSANAGGNVSVSYVKPNRSELCQAFSQVVSSYFSKSSLQKQIKCWR